MSCWVGLLAALRTPAALPVSMTLESALRVKRTIARLTTRLPDKYPGREIVFTAASFGIGGQLGLSRTLGPAEIEAAIDYNRAWSYRPSMQFHRTLLGAMVRIGLATGH